MRSSDKQKRIFCTLLTKSMDSQLTVEETKQFNDLLAAYSDIESYYFECIQLHVALELFSEGENYSLTERMTADSQLVLDGNVSLRGIKLDELDGDSDSDTLKGRQITQALMELLEMERTAPAIEMLKENPKREQIQKVVCPPREKVKLSMFQKILFAATAAMILFIVLLNIIPQRPNEVEVATLVDQIRAVWDEDKQSPGTNGRILQDTYALVSGYISLRFDDGAQITVEAPAEFAVLSVGDMELFSGRIYAIVPEQARGFSVIASSSKIVDLGTEFGVQVDNKGNTQLHVTKGKTILFAGVLNGSKTQTEVRQGCAKKIYNDGFVNDIEISDRKFVRKIDSKTGLILNSEFHDGKMPFVAYHDFGATAGQKSTGNITTHHVGSDELGYGSDYSPMELINFADGSKTGVFIRIDHVNGLDSRENQYIRPPADGTPAYTLFNVPGLNLNNGMIRVGNKTEQLPDNYKDMTLTLEGLNPQLRYDLALYGDRSRVMNLQPGLERFTLGGADAAENKSSSGIIDNFTTDLETLGNADVGHVVRWTRIAPGADGTITVKVDAGFYGEDRNIAYLSAIRLEALSAGNIGDNNFKNE